MEKPLLLRYDDVRTDADTHEDHGLWRYRSADASLAASMASHGTRWRLWFPDEGIVWHDCVSKAEQVLNETSWPWSSAGSINVAPPTLVLTREDQRCLIKPHRFLHSAGAVAVPGELHLQARPDRPDRAAVVGRGAQKNKPASLENKKKPFRLLWKGSSVFFRTSREQV